MNKKTIAALASVGYPPRGSRQVNDEPKWWRLLQIIWTSGGANLQVFKRGLMVLSLFWRRLSILAGEIRTQVMVEIDRNPLAVRQGAATVMCLAAAAVAMPVISHRAAEQREGAEWAATSTAFQAELEQQLASAEPNARVELTSFRTPQGVAARGGANLFESADARAMMVQAVLRTPGARADAQAEPQVDAYQHACLSQAIYYEARGETQRGQVAVAEVVMNRVRSPYYPNSICGVVYQGSHRANGCQFTFTCDGSLNHRPRGRAWDRAQRVATAAMLGYMRPITQGATHYHTHAVNPIWNSGLVQTTNVGSHVFYRFPNRSERAHYREAMARRLATTPRRRAASPDEVLMEAAGVETQAVGQPAPAPAVVAPAAPAEADAPVETNPTAPAEAEVST